MNLVVELGEMLDASGGSRRSEPLQLCDRIEALYAVELASNVRRFLEELEQRDLGEASNLFQIVDGIELSHELADNAFASALDNSIALNSAFTASLALGNDGGGQYYYVALESPHDEVGIYGPGVGELRLLAEVLASTYVEENDLDHDAISEGEVVLDFEQEPELVRVKRALDALEGHLHLTGFEGTEVCSDFDELFMGLHGGPWNATPRSRLFADHERAYPLMRMLDHGGIWELDEAPSGFERPADALLAVWRAFFDSDDAALTAMLARAGAHPGGMVRDAASLIDGVLDGQWAGHSHLATLRELVLAGEPSVSTEPPAGSKSLFMDESGDDATMKKLKAAVRATPSNADAWDQLTFAYYAAQRWEPMHACAEVSIALAPRRYYGWMQRGVARMVADRCDEAIDDFNVALCFESNPNLYINKALSLLELGRRAEVMSTLRALPRHSRRALIEPIGDLVPFLDEL